MGKPKRPRDTNELAKLIVDLSTGEKEEPKKKVDEKFKELSDRGASKGGKARAKALTKKERSEIAKKAAKTRWDGKKK